jgi:hypothetical protein
MRRAFETQRLRQQHILRNLLVTLVTALVWMTAVAVSH